MKPYALISALAFCLCAGSDSAQQPAIRQPRSGTSKVTGHVYSGPGPSGRAASKRINELGTEISRAEEAHDYKTAERLTVQRMAIYPGNPMDYAGLAGLYEKEGRLREAYEEWRVALEAPTRWLGTMRTDSVYMSHYGDLALHFHDLATARSAYRASADRPLPDVRGGNIGASETIDELSANAHLAAAAERMSHGQIFEAIDDVRLCIKLQPRSAIARLAYARLLTRSDEKKQALREYETAFWLATPEERRIIHDEVVNRKKLVEEYGRAYVTENGKTRSHKVHLRDWPGPRPKEGVEGAQPLRKQPSHVK